METPIADFVRRYVDSGMVRAHMPGHKGQSLLGFEPWDITETVSYTHLTLPTNSLV